MAHEAPLGFDGLISAGEDDSGKGGEYTVEFSMTEAAEIEPSSPKNSDKRGTSEEVGLLVESGEVRSKKEPVSCKSAKNSS